MQSEICLSKSKDKRPSILFTSSSVTSFCAPNRLNWSKSAILSRIPPAEFFAIAKSASSVMLIFSLSEIYSFVQRLSMLHPNNNNVEAKIRQQLQALRDLGMSEFLGAIIASIFLVGFSNDFFMGCLYAVIAGIMMHISIYELLPSSFKYNKPFQTILFFLIGIIFMFVSSILLH